ncbi:xanthine dehydrogenase small subunit [Lacrimispora sp. 38-1]|uniref:xanthine dehydrogenase small subunit n=1 Tax=Lacrimispora sp. 38-1 TaxID=3125778 RepID=UPI003CF0DB64
MKKTIRFFLNGKLKEISVNGETTVLELLRSRFQLNGIKEGCGEGDCGACTVVIGEVREGKVHYKSAAGCLYLAAKLEGKHLITIEGLAQKEKLHPIQEAVLNAHATQCGFCTPGVILSILALYLERPNPGKEEFRRYLEGNLCRCTGYAAIRKVPEYLEDLTIDSGNIRPFYLDQTEEKQLAFVHEDIFIDDGVNAYYSPVSEENLEAFIKDNGELVSGKNLRFLNGGSDVVVGIKKRNQHYRLLVDISRISSLQKISYGESHELIIGGGVTLSAIIDTVKQLFPQFSDAVSGMCSEQIRSSATLAGNLVNASPVADTVPLLMAMNAVLTIRGCEGTRRVPVREFYHGYKQTENKSDEWVASISIPLGEYDFIHFEKVSKRKEVDISAVNSAIALKTSDGVIKKASIACGGVGPTTLFMPETSHYLEGKSMTEETFLGAYEIIGREAAPIGDVRGSADYRKAVMQNLLMKHYLAYESSQEADGHEE